MNGPADAERVDRFLAAFNAVDRLLRERTGVADHGVPFRTVLRRFLRDQRWRGAAEALRLNQVINCRAQSVSFLGCLPRDW